MNKDNTSMLTEPIVKFFRGKNFGFLGTVNKDGSPQVTPTWIDIIEKEENEVGREEIILINTATTIKGRVVEQTTEGADEHIDKLAKRYLNADRYPAHSPSVKRIILKVKP